MARKVFFSFHYADIMLVSQIRQSWRIRRGGETQPFHDRAEWEKVKRQTPSLIKKWIDDQLRGSTVTVVLVGAQTSNREWVEYEINSSIVQKKGIVFIDLGGMRTTQGYSYRSGGNPAFWKLQNGRSLYEYYKTYSWVSDDGYNNLGTWIEEAFNATKP